MIFDQEGTYEYLKQNKIPYTGWPKQILSQIITNKV